VNITFTLEALLFSFKVSHRNDLYWAFDSAMAWLRVQDSNLRPTAYETVELTTAPTHNKTFRRPWCIIVT
jgi:hypothetical protein